MYKHTYACKQVLSILYYEKVIVIGVSLYFSQIYCYLLNSVMNHGSILFLLSSLSIPKPCQSHLSIEFGHRTLRQSLNIIFPGLIERIYQLHKFSVAFWLVFLNVCFKIRTTVYLFLLLYESHLLIAFLLNLGIGCTFHTYLVIQFITFVENFYLPGYNLAYPLGSCFNIHFHQRQIFIWV